MGPLDAGVGRPSATVAQEDKLAKTNEEVKSSKRRVKCSRRQPVSYSFPGKALLASGGCCPSCGGSSFGRIVGPICACGPPYRLMRRASGLS